LVTRVNNRNVVAGFCRVPQIAEACKVRHLVTEIVAVQSQRVPFHEFIFLIGLGELLRLLLVLWLLYENSLNVL